MKLTSKAELARITGYTPARITQMVEHEKTLLPPDVQFGQRWFYSEKQLARVLAIIPQSAGQGKRKKA